MRAVILLLVFALLDIARALGGPPLENNHYLFLALLWWVFFVIDVTEWLARLRQ